MRDAGAKGLLWVGLVVLSLSAQARDIEPLTDEEKETLAFALEQANTAIAALEARMEECEKTERSRVLDPALFKGFSLSEQEWRYALFVLHSRADARCVNQDGAHHRALVALMQFKDIEKFHTGKNATKTAHEPESFCCDISAPRSEMHYRRLDPKVRQRLEAIPGIDEPFSLFKTIDALQAAIGSPVGKK